MNKQDVDMLQRVANDLSDISFIGSRSRRIKILSMSKRMIEEAIENEWKEIAVEECPWVIGDQVEVKDPPIVGQVRSIIYDHDFNTWAIAVRISEEKPSNYILDGADIYAKDN